MKPGDVYTGPNRTKYTLCAWNRNVVLMNDEGFFHVVSYDDFMDRYKEVKVARV